AGHTRSNHGHERDHGQPKSHTESARWRSDPGDHAAQVAAQHKKECRAQERNVRMSIVMADGRLSNLVANEDDKCLKEIPTLAFGGTTRYYLFCQPAKNGDQYQ